MFIAVPYHLDEPLEGFAWPFAAGRTISVELPDGDPWARMAALYDAVADAVWTEPGPATVMSGDCTTSLGVMAGLQRAGLDPAVVWLDAHGDLQTVETTTSGYLGGMPLRILLGYRPDLIADRLGLRPVAADRVVLVGARDLDPPEAEFLAGSAVRRCPVDELSAATLPEGPFYLHLDCDVTDPADLPGLLYPAPGGPALTAVAAAVGRALDTGRVAAFGLACTWHSNPRTAALAAAALPTL